MNSLTILRLSNVTHQNSYKNITTVYEFAYFFFFKLSRTYIFVCRGSTFRNDLIIMLFIFGVKIFKENRADGSSWKQHNMIFYMITWLDRILPKWTVTSNSSTIFLRIRFPSFLFFFFFLFKFTQITEWGLYSCTKMIHFEYILFSLLLKQCICYFRNLDCSLKIQIFERIFSQ